MLGIVRKGGRAATIALAPQTVDALDHTRDSLDRSAAYTVAGWLG